MLVGCRIRKGARHQIRAHLAAAGHPLAGDSLYGAELPCPSGFLFASRAGLVSRFPSLPPSRVASAASSGGAGESHGVFRNGKRMTIGGEGETS